MCETTNREHYLVYLEANTLNTHICYMYQIYVPIHTRPPTIIPSPPNYNISKINAPQIHQYKHLHFHSMRGKTCFKAIMPWDSYKLYVSYIAHIRLEIIYNVT